MSEYNIEDEYHLKNILFNDYQLIKKMLSPEGMKVKLLSTLFSVNPNCWRVVGITPKALEIFSEYGFKKVSGMGINRSHITQRHSHYKSFLQKDIANSNDFWEEYYRNDMTVLSTSSENMSNAKSIINESYLIPEDKRSLFKTLGYAWKHKTEEEEFLYNLHQTILNNGKIPLLKEHLLVKNINH